MKQGLLLGFLVCFTLHSGCEGYIEHPGPRYPPTKGYVWPEPQYLRSTTTQLKVDPTDFKFNIVGDNTCQTLTEAIDRYNALLIKQLGIATTKMALQIETNMRHLQKLTYIFQQLANSGLLWTWTKTYLVINETNIHDYPRFPHRGILLDTCRHFVSVDKIYTLLDGMVYNKLNVFHWHIVDDQSFPFVSATFPNISELGAYHSSMIYTPETVANIVEYARLRGIRVLPEFDTPGHTRSWGVAFPKLLTECYTNNQPNGDLGPMNPAESSVYTFMEQLLAEIVEVFPDKYVHLGGDEVDFDCWESNPEITSFMSSNNLDTYYKLEEYYIQKIVDMVEKLNSKSVVWQEVFVNGASLQDGTVVQIWTGDQAALLADVTSKGLPALLSACWYLDHLSTGGDWQKFYSCEPLDFEGTKAQKSLVKGGEACMWAEVIDNNNVVSRVFPRASATAEKLWSAADIGGSNLYNRIEEHYCRLNIRGIPAQPPSGPGFCTP